MNFDEAVSIRVSLDSLAPALESFGLAIIYSAGMISICMIIAAIIRASK